MRKITKRNKKGQTMGLAILSTIAVFVIGFMFINFLMPEVTNFRTDMNCISPNISDGSKLMCLMGDLAIPYIMLSILSLAVGAITARMTL